MADRRPGEFPDVLEVVVEIPSGSRNKYEFDEMRRRPSRSRSVVGVRWAKLERRSLLSRGSTALADRAADLGS